MISMFYKLVFQPVKADQGMQKVLAVFKCIVKVKNPRIPTGERQ